MNTAVKEPVLCDSCGAEIKDQDDPVRCCGVPFCLPCYDEHCDKEHGG